MLILFFWPWPHRWHVEWTSLLFTTYSAFPQNVFDFDPSTYNPIFFADLTECMTDTSVYRYFVVFFNHHFNKLFFPWKKNQSDRFLWHVSIGHSPVTTDDPIFIQFEIQLILCVSFIKLRLPIFSVKLLSIVFLLPVSRLTLVPL